MRPGPLPGCAADSHVTMSWRMCSVLTMIEAFRVFSASGKEDSRKSRESARRGQKLILQCKTSRRTLDRDDQLRDHRQHFRAGVDQHVLDTLFRQECVWLLDFAKPVEENREVVVEVQLVGSSRTVGMSSCQTRDLFINMIHYQQTSTYAPW